MSNKFGKTMRHHARIKVGPRDETRGMDRAYMAATIRRENGLHGEGSVLPMNREQRRAMRRAR